MNNFPFRLSKNGNDQQLNRMMEIDSLLIEYQEYLLNRKSEITNKTLVEQSREFLTTATVKPEDRFVPLNIDFYRNVLGKISSNFKSDEESLQRITTGFNSLEKYGVNLWKFPWRKEYHTIKVCFVWKIYAAKWRLNQSRPQMPPSFWSAPGIETSGLD